MPIEHLMSAAAALLLISVLFSKFSERLGVPSLLLFLAVGMLAGEDGPGRIPFNDPWMAQSLGVVALTFLLFAGGLDTDWKLVRPVLWQGLSLSTVGVLVSALAVGGFASAVLGFSWIEGCLLGAIVASTDAAAVFTVLRSRNVNLKGRLKPLLELESGSNDPMAVFLTLGFIGLLTRGESSWWSLAPAFLRQMSLGLLLGYVFGRGAVMLVNRLKLEYEGLYPVLTLSLVMLTHGAAFALGGNGYLAVYVAGLVLGNSNFIHKRSLVRFHDGLAWLMQIAMFLTLGLLVSPHKLLPVAGQGILLSLFLIFAARPASVFLSLLFARVSVPQKLMVSWTGLRGAVPIVLATFPLLENLPQAGSIFHLVFFIVLTSVLFQGVSIPSVAKLLKVDAPLERRRRRPIEMDELEGSDMNLEDFILPFGSRFAGRPVIELNFPPESRITLIARGDKFLMPKGDTVLEEGDILWVLANSQSLPEIKRILSGK